jgi:small-conductance mechanosensitive channel
MFGLIKFLIAVYRAFVALLDPNRNALKDAPPQIKYITSVLLASFWAVAFSLWAGELYFIGYNVIGHVAVVSMAFATWLVFRHFRKTYTKRSEYDLLRDPNRLPKCYELTDEERLQAAQKASFQN